MIEVKFLFIILRLSVKYIRVLLLVNKGFIKGLYEGIRISLVWVK